MIQYLDKPFERSYWVIPNKFLAGCYPGSQDLDEASKKLRGLLNCGIRLIINLTEPFETNYYGDGFVPYETPLTTMANSLGVEIQYLRFAIADMRIPSKEYMVKVLDTIDDAIASDTPVYVHCWGGVGRTGTVVGCYLARHGIALGRECLEQIQELRWNDPTAYRRSPETRQQVQMVLSWKPQE